MPSSGLRGIFPLTVTGVDNAVLNDAPGVFALGILNKAGSFVISYVGRGDTDVNDRLKEQVPSQHPEFRFEYFPSAMAAFEKECDLYHDFDPPENKVHPDKPEGTNYRCPRCDALD